MAFHCGNTCATCLADPELKHQVIMHRLMEPDRAPDITRGTLEGRLRPGPTTLFRLQATPAGELASYLAEGRILDRDPQSFGAIGVVAVPGFQRFYRHVLLENGFPHHGAFGFTHVGRILFAALRYLGLQDIGVPLPAGERYPGECPF